jgi:hypothetical protein
LALTPADIAPLDSFGKAFRDRLQEISGNEELEAYTNLSHGDEGPEVWYTKAHVPKLKKLKKKYDPASLFSFYNPI